MEYVGTAKDVTDSQINIVYADKQKDRQTGRRIDRQIDRGID